MEPKRHVISLIFFFKLCNFNLIGVDKILQDNTVMVSFGLYKILFCKQCFVVQDELVNYLKRINPSR